MAKVTRDRLCIDYEKRWPQYGFLQHKGYGTKAHFAAIYKHGPCPIHRRSFEPVKTLCGWSREDPSTGKEGGKAGKGGKMTGKAGKAAGKAGKAVVSKAGKKAGAAGKGSKGGKTGKTASKTSGKAAGKAALFRCWGGFGGSGAACGARNTRLHRP